MGLFDQASLGVVVEATDVLILVIVSEEMTWLSSPLKASYASVGCKLLLQSATIPISIASPDAFVRHNRKVAAEIVFTVHHRTVRPLCAPDTQKGVIADGQALISGVRPLYNFAFRRK